MTTEITRLEQELKEKHEREIQAASCDEVRQDMETLDLESSDSKRETGKKSKAQRRKVRALLVAMIPLSYEPSLVAMSPLIAKCKRTWPN